MKYERIHRAKFLERPNRFIAYGEVDGKKEVIHVKNTGRCAELLRPGSTIYIQESDNPLRKTKWDLIAVEKGDRMINMDSQIPNKAVKEWIEQGNLFENVTLIRPETTYGNSRFDLYVETKDPVRKIFVEIKGVTLEEKGICRFPDAPSERAVKHLEELIEAKKEGYEAYVFFVIQMKGVDYFTPNVDTHPQFAEALRKAAKSGVGVLAYDCQVTSDRIEINNPVEVVLGNPLLKESVIPLVEWFRSNQRDLPWRKQMNAYRVWISEIMLQQTRVEAVKPYYERFLSELPDVKALAEVPEEKLLKLWEGLGYYNRARNLQKAAQQIMTEYHGEFPHTFEEIRSLQGIGSYTAGAISSFVYHLPKPAVDGNVLRVVTRLLADDSDIAKAATKTKIEGLVEEVIPKDCPGDFNQSLIELGAIVCTPGGVPKCEQCPLSGLCVAHREGKELDFPVKKKSKERRVEKRTVILLRDQEKIMIRKRPKTGLLAGLYEFPNTEGHLKQKEVIEYVKALGITPVRVKKLDRGKHVFSHVEWHMIGYEVIADEIELLKQPVDKGANAEVLFARHEDVKERYPMPSAFELYQNYYEHSLQK